MSEVAEAPVAVESTDSTPPPEPVVETPVPQTPPPVAPVVETPALEAQPPREYSLQDLDGLYREGKLTDPSLVTQRERLRQSYDDQQRAYQQAVQERRFQEEQRKQELQSLGARTRAEIQFDIDSEMKAAATAFREPDPVLIQDRINRRMEAYEQRQAEIHLEPFDTALGTSLLRLYGDSPRNRDAVNSMTLADKITRFGEAMYQRGQTTPPTSDYVVKTKKEYDAEVAKAVEEFKTTIPGLAPPSTTGGTPSMNLTLSQIDAMPTHEWMALGDKETRDAILARAHEQDQLRR